VVHGARARGRGKGHVRIVGFGTGRGLSRPPTSFAAAAATTPTIFEGQPKAGRGPGFRGGIPEWIAAAGRARKGRCGASIGGASASRSSAAGGGWRGKPSPGTTLDLRGFRRPFVLGWGLALEGPLGRRPRRGGPGTGSGRVGRPRVPDADIGLGPRGVPRRQGVECRRRRKTALGRRVPVRGWGSAPC